MSITLTYPAGPPARSLAAAEVRTLFGLPAGDAGGEVLVADGVEIDVRPGDVLLITGPSGAGKSSVLRELGRRLGAVDVAALTLPDGCVVDGLPGPVPGRLALLSACGLGEARLMLRPVAALSDGQRARFRLAFALATRPGEALMLDEFAAVLDRTLAKVVAFNVRKLASRTGTAVLAATTHDDLTADLDPDVHVACRGDGVVTVARRAEGGGAGKKPSASPARCGSATAPVPTGRTSRGGITGGTTSGSSAG